MSQASRSAASAAPVRMLHGVLLAGQLMLAVVVAVVVSLPGPLNPDASVIGLAMAGVAFVMLSVVMGILQPRVAKRESGRDGDAYWKDPATRTSVQLVWFLAEGATVTALVGYLLSGVTMAAVVAGAGMLAFLWLRPAHFDNG